MRFGCWILLSSQGSSFLFDSESLANHLKSFDWIFYGDSEGSALSIFKFSNFFGAHYKVVLKSLITFLAMLKTIIHAQQIFKTPQLVFLKVLMLLIRFLRMYNSSNKGMLMQFMTSREQIWQ